MNGESSVDPASAVLACPAYPEDVITLLDVLRFQVECMPERIVCHRVRRDRRGLRADPMTVAELVVRSARAAASLQDIGVGPGDRVILSLSDPHDFLVGFCAALLRGAAAVPLPTVVESGAPKSFAARVQAVVRDCWPRAAVVDDAGRFQDTVAALPEALAVIAASKLSASERAISNEWVVRSPSSPAFIQYTSGSTGAPRGVVVTHANLLANCAAIRDATAYTRADRMVSWLPLHHDMGLVGGLLTSIYCAAETWLMPPLLFLGRPVTWLEAVSRFAATLTVAPTFAYSLAARKIPDSQLDGIDLSHMRLAYIGAEKIDPGTVQAFTSRFARYGLPPNALYPVYGLAEATLAVTFPQPGTEVRFDTVDRRRLAAEGAAVPATTGAADAVTFVSVGQALPRHRVRIEDSDTREVLGERRVGELVAEGESVTPRYFGEDDEVARADLRTGDLAYQADGHVYIVDRIKDLVIVAGQNYAPSDIESVASRADGVRLGRVVAFSAPGEMGSEVLHIVAEINPDTWRTPADIAADVQRLVRAEIGLSPASVSIVAAGSLERTSSGKIKRVACAEAHRRGTLRLLEGRSGLLVAKASRRRAELAARVSRLLSERSRDRL